MRYYQQYLSFRRSAWVPLVALLCGWIGVSGCTAMMRIQVKTSQATNGGEPFYVVVRSSGSDALASSDYKSIASNVFRSTAESTVLSKEVLLPGQISHLEIRTPDEDNIAVYFLFTDPGPNWYYMFRNPLPSEAKISLGAHEIQKIAVQGR